MGVRIIRGVFPVVLLHSNACCAVKPLNSVAKATEAVSANSCCSASSTAACGRFRFRLLASLKRLEKRLGRDNSIVQCKPHCHITSIFFWTFAAAQWPSTTLHMSLYVTDAMFTLEKGLSKRWCCLRNRKKRKAFLQSQQYLYLTYDFPQPFEFHNK